MEENETYSREDLKKYNLPKWNEIPDIELYIDQVVSYLEKYLKIYFDTDSAFSPQIVTKTMINNYVKHHVIKPPVAKKYGREHIAYLFVIFILKQIYSIEDIKKLLKLAIHTSSIENSYDNFCSALELSILTTFSKKSPLVGSSLTPEQYLLRNTTLSFANKLYVQKTFLRNNNSSIK